MKAKDHLDTVTWLEPPLSPTALDPGDTVEVTVTFAAPGARASTLGIGAAW